MIYTDPLGHLSMFPRWRQDLEHAQFDAVGLAREHGATWDEIGEALGISGAAVHKRYANLTPKI